MITGPNDVSDMSFGLRYMFFFSIFVFFYTFYYYFRFDLYFESTVRARAGSRGAKMGPNNASGMSFRPHVCVFYYQIMCYML